MSLRLPHCFFRWSLALMMAAVSPSLLAAAPAPGSKRLPTKVSFVDTSSSESPAAREKRLKRECKGRPNAGACLGHTR